MKRTAKALVWLVTLFLFGPAETRLLAIGTVGMRVVWQDRERKSLRWGDFQKQGEEYKFKEGESIQGFPSFDPASVELVQMERIDDMLVIGIRDFDGGKKSSGWVAVKISGAAPQVVAKQVDTQQGNPAHLYVHDEEFYVANDRLSGFTRISPNWLANPGEAEATKPRFFRGGKSHITLAAFGEQVAYATHMASTESGKGMIDVVDLRKTGEESLAYTIESPTAGLHGAIANSGKVFFAPSDGLNWIKADVELTCRDNPPSLNYISLGNNPHSGRPNRTGAFTNAHDWVLFVTGAREDSKLGMVQASLGQPEVISVSIPCEEGISLVSPEFGETTEGLLLAYVFQDKQSKFTGDAQEELVIINLDPNGDRNFEDAKIHAELPVGASRVDGHYGHHSLSAVPEVGMCAFTNPGEGELAFMTIDGTKIIWSVDVGGMPTKIVGVPLR